MDDKRPPIEPGPEPDTTDAAEPDDTDARLDPEHAPDMLDHGDDHVDETPI
ncbi:MAG: hypothetical protein ABW024_06765 [Microbacterium sp.]